MELDLADYEDTMHCLITSIVTPRPIGWISTRTDERDNLAPLSYFNVVSSYPLGGHVLRVASGRQAKGFGADGR